MENIEIEKIAKCLGVENQYLNGPKQNISKKLIEIQKKIRIKRSGKKNIDGNIVRYSTSADYNSEIRNKLAEANIFVKFYTLVLKNSSREFITSSKKKTYISTFEVEVYILLMDADSNEVEIISGYGADVDYGKSAYNKATTAAIKSIWKRNFIIDDYSDSEDKISNESPKNNKTQKPQSTDNNIPNGGVKMLLSYGKVLKWDDSKINEFAQSKFKKKLNDLNSQEAKKLLEEMKKFKAA